MSQRSSICTSGLRCIDKCKSSMIAPNNLPQHWQLKLFLSIMKPWIMNTPSPREDHQDIVVAKMQCHMHASNAYSRHILKCLRIEKRRCKRFCNARRHSDVAMRINRANGPWRAQKGIHNCLPQWDKLRWVKTCGRLRVWCRTYIL